METSCTYTGSVMFVSTDERKMITRLMKLKEAHPDAVEILALPPNNDGCLYCKVPASWLRIAPPKKRDLSDEERAELAERFRANMSKKNLEHMGEE